MPIPFVVSVASPQGLKTFRTARTCLLVFFSFVVRELLAGHFATFDSMVEAGKTNIRCCEEAEALKMLEHSYATMMMFTFTCLFWILMSRHNFDWCSCLLKPIHFNFLLTCCRTFFFRTTVHFANVMLFPRLFEH